MDLQTIAEFAEDKHLITVLTELGVDYVQGYAVALPAPVEEMFNIHPN